MLVCLASGTAHGMCLAAVGSSPSSFDDSPAEVACSSRPFFCLPWGEEDEDGAKEARNTRRGAPITGAGPVLTRKKSAKSMGGLEAVVDDSRGVDVIHV